MYANAGAAAANSFIRIENKSIGIFFFDCGKIGDLCLMCDTTSIYFKSNYVCKYTNSYAHNVLTINEINWNAMVSYCLRLGYFVNVMVMTQIQSSCLVD